MHRTNKTQARAVASRRPAAAEPALVNAERADAAERAASLERRRKAFFANQPDNNEPAGDNSSAPVGLTLGGSGGLRPEMGLRF